MQIATDLKIDEIGPAVDAEQDVLRLVGIDIRDVALVYRFKQHFQLMERIHPAPATRATAAGPRRTNGRTPYHPPFRARAAHCADRPAPGKTAARAGTTISPASASAARQNRQFGRSSARQRDCSNCSKTPSRRKKSCFTLRCRWIDRAVQGNRVGQACLAEGAHGVYDPIGGGRSGRVRGDQKRRSHRLIIKSAPAVQGRNRG